MVLSIANNKQQYLKPSNHLQIGLLVLDYTQLRGSLNKFPDFSRMGTFIDSTHMKL